MSVGKLNVVHTFLDCMPSEQGGFSDNPFIMYSQVFFGGPRYKEIGDLREYKDCSLPQRQNTVRTLCELIEADELWVQLLCFACKHAVARTNGFKLLQEIININGNDIRPKSKIEFAGMRIELNRAVMYANFAIALALHSRKLSSLTKKYGAKRGEIVLDLLPGDQGLGGENPGLSFVRMLSEEHPFLQKMWQDSRSINPNAFLDFCYVNSEIQHGWILADWIAQSAHAAVNQNEFRANVKKKREQRRQDVAKIIFAIREQYTRLSEGTPSLIMPLGEIETFQYEAWVAGMLRSTRE